jgi:hypothetical protein
MAPGAARTEGAVGACGRAGRRGRAAALSITGARRPRPACRMLRILSCRARACARPVRTARARPAEAQGPGRAGRPRSDAARSSLDALSLWERGQPPAPRELRPRRVAPRPGVALHQAPRARAQGPRLDPADRVVPAALVSRAALARMGLRFDAAWADDRGACSGPASAFHASAKAVERLQSGLRHPAPPAAMPASMAPHPVASRAGPVGEATLSSAPARATLSVSAR